MSKNEILAMSSSGLKVASYIETTWCANGVFDVLLVESRWSPAINGKIAKIASCSLNMCTTCHTGNGTKTLVDHVIPPPLANAGGV